MSPSSYLGIVFVLTCVLLMGVLVYKAFQESGLVRRRRDAKRRATATHRHYKGGYYRVIDPQVRHTETDELMVLYEHVFPHPRGELKVRPHAVFYGMLPDGQRRFAPLTIDCEPG